MIKPYLGMLLVSLLSTTPAWSDPLASTSPPGPLKIGVIVPLTGGWASW